MLKYNLDIPKLFVYSDYYIYAKNKQANKLKHTHIEAYILVWGSKLCI